MLVFEDDLVRYFASIIVLPAGLPHLSSLYLAELLASNRLPSKEPFTVRLLAANTNFDLLNIAEDALLIAGPFKGMMSRVMKREYYLNICETAYGSLTSTPWACQYNQVYSALAQDSKIFADILEGILK